LKPLNIAVIVKNANSTKRDNRAMGYFSYDVPEFTWEFILPGKRFNINWRKFKGERQFDLVFHEDYPYGNIIGLDIPYVFLSIDSTLSEAHYKDRLRQTSHADLVLVDHDNLNRFNVKHCNVYQFPYCVNNRVFYKSDDIRTTDIAYHCSSSAHAGIDERKRIRKLLSELSLKYNWNYKSGILPLEQYAESFRSSKIVVNQSRTPTNRPHRIFDAMACGAMVLSSRIPYIKEDKLTMYDDDVLKQFGSDYYLENELTNFLSTPYALNHVANNGYNIIMNNHTWAIRARQLREIINKEFEI
jgi:glycosyl transferase family 1